MRRRNLLTPFALAAMVAACGGGVEDEMDGMGEAAMEARPAMAGSLACQPTATGADLAGRASPYDSTTIAVGHGQAKICYSRPALRGRTMIGSEAVPYDTLWRTGANEPTIIHLSAAAEIAGMRVEPGSYSLYTVPRAGDRWTLIVNRSTSQWGAEGRYSPEVRAQEVGRADVAAERIEQPVERFTIRPMESGRPGVLIEWQNSRVRIPVQPVNGHG
jgi:hypothetical protein